MQAHELFGIALGLVSPWYVDTATLDVEHRELVLRIDFERGGVFSCPDCRTPGCKAYDTQEKSWRHLDFFQYRTTLTARTPRITCDRCGVRPVGVPWARNGSGFTLMFEALVLSMVKHMPVRAIGQLVGEHDTRLWRLIDYYVEMARQKRDDSQVQTVGIDETASRRGHSYVSLFADMEAGRVLYVAEGKDSGTVTEFVEDLQAHGGKSANITEVSMDMSAAFQKGVREALPAASVTFDKFHVVALVNDAVDKTRKQDREDNPELKGQRYALLRNPETMSNKQLDFSSWLLLKRPTMKTARALHLRLAFQDLYIQHADNAADYLRRWCSWAQRSRIPEMVRVAQTVRKNFDGILRWFTSHLTNGRLEAINGLVQAAKARARGYRTTKNLAAMIYLIAGKLDLSVTHCS